LGYAKSLSNRKLPKTTYLYSDDGSSRLQKNKAVKDAETAQRLAVVIARANRDSKRNLC